MGQVLQRGERPIQRGLWIAAAMLIELRQLDVSVDVPLCGCLLPQAQRLIEIAAALLQNREAAHRLPEIGLRQAHLQSTLEQPRGCLPLAEILVQAGDRDHVQHADESSQECIDRRQPTQPFKLAVR